MSSEITPTNDPDDTIIETDSAVPMLNVCTICSDATCPVCGQCQSCVGHRDGCERKAYAPPFFRPPQPVKRT